MILALKNILFTLVVPGTVGVYLPLILSRGRNAATDFFLGLAIIFFVIGGSIYSWCVFDFASFGRGTPAPIDAPKLLDGYSGNAAPLRCPPPGAASARQRKPHRSMGASSGRESAYHSPSSN